MNILKFFRQPVLATLLATFFLVISCTSDNNSNDDVSVNNELWRTMELSDLEIKKMASDHNVYLKKIYDKMYNFKSSKTENDQFEDIKIELIEEFSDESEVQSYSEFIDNVRNVNLEDLLENDFEKEYVQNITSTLYASNNHQELSDDLDVIINTINEDSRDFFKTPLKLYAETLKESAYYWWSAEKGGSGIGYKVMQKRGKTVSMKTMQSAAETDGKAISGGMIGIAAYGTWGVLFGPVGFALTGASFIAVVVGSAYCSAVF
jgi:hypothetical protein